MTLQQCAARLREGGCEQPLALARSLFRHIAHLSDTQLFGADPVWEDDTLTEAVARLCAGEPRDYVLGFTDFYRERYCVSPAVLIPRPETELLVEYAVTHLPTGARVLDLCTGSGCVGLSILANTTATFATLVDASEAALAVARRNAEALALTSRTDIVQKDVLRETVDGDFDAIVSNPPYVNDAVYDTLDARLVFEPKMAFVGGEDGMDFYRAILRDYRHRLRANGFFAFEIGYDQGERMRALAQAHDLSATITQDLAGHDRLAVLRPR